MKKGKKKRIIYFMGSDQERKKRERLSQVPKSRLGKREDFLGDTFFFQVTFGIGILLLSRGGNLSSGGKYRYPIFWGRIPVLTKS